jgi:hypothetical protein
MGTPRRARGGVALFLIGRLVARLAPARERRGTGVSCFICFAERHRNPSIFYDPNRCTHISAL